MYFAYSESDARELFRHGTSGVQLGSWWLRIDFRFCWFQWVTCRFGSSLSSTNRYHGCSLALDSVFGLNLAREFVRKQKLQTNTKHNFYFSRPTTRNLKLKQTKQKLRTTTTHIRNSQATPFSPVFYLTLFGFHTHLLLQKPEFESFAILILIWSYIRPIEEGVGRRAAYFAILIQSRRWSFDITAWNILLFSDANQKKKEKCVRPMDDRSAERKTNRNIISTSTNSTKKIFNVATNK